MSSGRISFLLIYLAALLSAQALKIITFKIANKAIKDERLASGLYSFYPIEGKKAVELAKGYIRGVQIYFWFNVLFFPLCFLILYFSGAI